MNEFRKFLLKNRITPKWAIFLLDMVICLITFMYAHYLLTDFKIVSIDSAALLKGLLFIAASSSLFFYLFKTYEGIIRLSEVQESIRAISAVFCTFSLALGINFICRITGNISFIPNSVLFVYFFTTSFIICGYRILVKTLYNESVGGIDTISVIIYGAGNTGTLLHKTISSISFSQYQVAAFVDDDVMLRGKTIDGIRIHSSSELPVLIKAYKVRNLFFSRPDMDVAEKNKVVDICLASQVKVMNIPPVKSWMQGKLNLSQLQEVKIEELLDRPAIQLQNEQVINYLSNKKILITGAAGSIGSELARQVAALNPASLIILDQLETALYELEYELKKKYTLGNKLHFFLGDVKDYTAMEQLFHTHKPDVIFHAAAYKHVPVMERHPSEAVRNNVLGTKTLAELACIYGADRFLFVSTDKAINPTNIMGASKRIAEMYCMALQNSHSAESYSQHRLPFAAKHKTKFITTRFGNVLASNGSVILRFKEQIAGGGPVTVTHPEIIRYFMTIQEACSLLLEAVTMGQGGEVFLFDMGKPVKILDLAKKMIMLAGYEPVKDIAIEFTGLRPGEKLYEELLNKTEEVIPTHHKKILIANMENHIPQNTIQSVESLIALANESLEDDVVKQMKRMLPQYISNNSVYEMYDSKELSKISTAIQ